MHINKKNIRGQAVLIVLLSLSVVLIIVLFIMSRSITDISLSSKEENSLRAFSAAEAGIEKALVGLFAVGSTGPISVGDAEFNANVSNFAEGSSSVVFPLSLKSGESATFWFTRPGETAFSGNQAKFCWGTKDTSSSTAETPAVEVTVYYLESGIYKVARATLDPNSGRTVSNLFSGATVSLCTIDGEQFQFQSSLNLSSLTSLQYATVKILYNNTLGHKIGIDVAGSGSILPSQGVKIDSQGSASDSNRRIEAYQLHPVAPPIFENVLFSSTGITK